MELALSLLTVVAFALLALAIVTVLAPLAIAPIKALLRRDPGGAFVPHSQLVRSRLFATLYAGLGLVLLIGFQPHPFRRRDGPVPASVAGSPEVQARVAEAVAPRIQSGDLMGVVVGVVEPAGTQVFGYGQRRLGALPPDGQSVFEIGEVSRVFTTLLVARMAERRQVGLHQPVRELLPDSVSVPTFQQQPITIEQLATDRSGLPGAPPNRPRSPLEWCPPFHDPYGRYGVTLLHHFLSASDLARAPGSRIETSVLGMGLLAHALARVARTSFDTLATREICDPLVMPDTRVTLTRSMRDRLAQGYVICRGSYREWRVASPAHRWSYGALTGAGGFLSTANDLLSFLQAQLALRSSDLAAAMAETRRARYRGRGLEAIGMGWSVRLGSTAGGSVVWCHGGTGGTRCWIGMDEARKIGVVVLANSTADVDPLGFDLLRSLP